ncbi:hypothetical protein [Puia dinghuensis]|uniref:hypothetical protein n=1 Tax=Puia dinghuensis TaxID=1792502 RepID=UPI00166E61B0|nr:hypothetical protein [Puia dinghuensis]
MGEDTVSQQYWRPKNKAILLWQKAKKGLSGYLPERPQYVVCCLTSLVVNRRQLMLRRSGYHNLLGCFCLRLGIKGVENGRTNKNGEEEGDNVHAYTEKEGLPAADCVKSSSIHWILD